MLTRVQREHKGSYTCFAHNDVGTDSRRILLTVTGKNHFKLDI